MSSSISVSFRGRVLQATVVCLYSVPHIARRHRESRLTNQPSLPTSPADPFTLQPTSSQHNNQKPFAFAHIQGIDVTTRSSFCRQSTESYHIPGLPVHSVLPISNTPTSLPILSLAPCTLFSLRTRRIFRSHQSGR